MFDKQIRRESPLVNFGLNRKAVAQPGKAGVTAAERAFLGHLNLRGDPGDAGFLEAVERVLGVGLPLTPNTAAGSDELTVYWLCPDEWLIVTGADRQTALEGELRQALGEHHVAITDVSGGQTVLRLGGPRLRDLLAKGCSLDLHPRQFRPGQCAQTLYAKAPVLLRAVDAGTFELVVRRSFADYLWQWLEDAAGEYGLAVLAADAQTAAPPAAKRQGVVS